MAAGWREGYGGDGWTSREVVGDRETTENFFDGLSVFFVGPCKWVREMQECCYRFVQVDRGGY